MQKIWKYQLHDEVENKISLPTTAKVVRFDRQIDNLCMWVAVDDLYLEKLEERVFKIIPTGADFGNFDTYRGTVITDNGLVWHLIELRKGIITKGV